MMSNDLENINEFQRRRKATWKAARLWVALMAVGWVVIFWVGDMDSNSSPQCFVIGIIFFILLAIAMVRIVYIVRATYRCPVCNAIPMDRGLLFGTAIASDDGVMLNPKKCPSCGVSLTP